LGLAIDVEANESAGGKDADLTAPAAGTQVLVVQAREDVEIARQVRAAISRS
jgi:acetate kinase